MRRRRFLGSLFWGMLLLLMSEAAYAQNFWQQTNGPYGGVLVYSLAIKPGGLIFAGTDGSGVFRSTDNGGSWKAANIGLTNTYVYSLLINSSGEIFTGSEAGVYRSTDNGESWASVNLELGNSTVRSLAINSSGHIFAGTDKDGVFRSTNNGASWDKVYAISANPRVLSLLISASGHIYAGTDGNGVMRSTDNGGSWTSANIGLTRSVVRSLVVNSGGQIFAGTDSGGVFRSTDNGGSWTAANRGLTSLYTLGLAVNSNGRIFVGMGVDGGLFRSTDNGDNWQAVSTGLTSNSVFSFAFDSSGQIFAGTNFGGVCRSTNNGTSWTATGAGLTGSVIWALAANSSGQILAGTYGNGMYRSTDYGASWAEANTGLTTTVIRSLAVNSVGDLYAGTDWASVARSTDNGQSWKAASTGIADVHVYVLAMNASGHIFIGTYQHGMYRSTDNGDSWSAINTGLPIASINAIVIDSSGNVFAGGAGQVSGIYRSTNDGATWTTVTTGTSGVFSLAINSRGHIFAGTHLSGIFRSTDGGAGWTAVNTGLTNTYVRALVINSRGHIYAGTNGGGVFRSADNGDSWSPVNTGLTNFCIWSLALNSSDQIFAGSYGNGVFRSAGSTREIPPGLISPSNGILNQPTSLTLAWEALSGAQSYHIQISGDSLFRGALFVDDSTVTGTTRVLTGLTKGIKYCWRVRAKAGTVYTLFSSTWSFQVVSTTPRVVVDSYWQQSNGPFDGYIRAIVTNSNGHVVAATRGGVFRSTDNGDNWTHVSDKNEKDQRLASIRCLTVHPNGSLFAGSDTGGVFRSTDNGWNWTQVGTGIMGDSIFGIGVSRKGNVFAGAQGGMFRSSDNGETWVQLGTGLPFTNIFCFVFDGAGFAFIGTRLGVFRSTDEGTSWAQSSAGLTNTDVRSLVLGKAGVMFAGTWGGGVYRSTNSGASWSAFSTGLTNSGVLSLALDAKGTVFAGTASRLFRLNSGGTEWTDADPGLPGDSWTTVSVNLAGNVFAGTQDLGVYRSTDEGVTWRQVNRGLTGQFLRYLVTAPNGSIFVAGNGIYRSTDDGSNWVKVDFNGIESLVIGASGHLFAGLHRSRVIRSTDNGETWIEASRGLPNTTSGYTWTSLAINANGHVFAGCGSDGVYRSTDDGQTWLQASGGLANAEVNAVAASPSGSLFAGTWSGGRIFRSTDNGGNWTDVSKGALSVGVFSIAVDDTGYVFAATSGQGVYRSTDGGENWTAVNTGMPRDVVYYFAQNADGDLFAGTRTGLYRSTNRGFSWTSVSTVPVWSLAFDDSGYLYGATWGFGLLKSVQRTTNAAAPAVATSTAANVGGTSATLKGNVNPRGIPTTAFFEWGVASTLPAYSATPTQSIGSGADSVVVTADLTGLDPSATYYYRIVGRNSAGTRKGAILSFTTASIPPSVSSSAATNVGTSYATLNGTVNPNGIQTTAYFAWGIDTLVANQTASQSLGSGRIPTAVTASLTSLNASTTHYYRIIAQNSAGSQKGVLQSFTTASRIPTAVILTSPVDGSTGQSMSTVLRWSEVPGALTYHVQVSLSPSFTTLIIDDTTIVSAFRQLSSLSYNTTYYWRVRGANSLGYGPFSVTWSFTTVLPLPAATTLVSPPTGSTDVSTSPVLSWNALAGAESYHLQVSTTSSFASLAFEDTAMTAVSQKISSLIGSTTYYWRVQGRNAAGYGPYSQTWMFTTTLGIPAAVIPLSPANGAVGVETQPTLTWSEVSGATSYHLQVSTVPTFTTAVFDDTTLITTSQKITPLAYNTTYYWRVRGKSATGYGPYSSVWSFTTVVAVPAAVTLVSPSDGSAGIATSPLLSWSPVSGAVTYHLQLSSTLGFVTKILDDSTITTASRQAGGLANSTAHYWRVRGKNAGGYGSFSPTWTFTTIPIYPASLTINASVVFALKQKASDYGATEYRLVGLPGSSDVLVKDIFTGVQNQDWEAVWDNGGTSDYLKRYDGSSDFKFSVGRAFWVISKTPLSIARTVPSATLNAAQEAEIPVRSGWNLIVNPFTSSIPWARIQAVNGITGSIYGFNGAFISSTTLDPFTGYYFFNGTPSPSLTTLRVPYSSLFGKVTEFEQKEENGWRMSVEVSTDGETGDVRSKTENAERERIQIGVEREAKDGLDVYDQRMPRGVGEIAQVLMNREEWDKEYPTFASDIRPGINGVEKWKMTVASMQKEKVTIKAQNVQSVPSQFQVCLIDRDGKRNQDLRTNPTYQFESQGTKREFVIVVGEPALVDQEAQKNLPSEIMVGPNYPNPFNPETIIPIELPKASDVKIVIYDILGRQVKMLYDGQLDVGRHWLRWDGRNERLAPVSSGIYFYRAILGNRMKIQRKMVVIR